MIYKEDKTSYSQQFVVDATEAADILTSIYSIKLAEGIFKLFCVYGRI